MNNTCIIFNKEFVSYIRRLFKYVSDLGMGLRSLNFAQHVWFMDDEYYDPGVLFCLWGGPKAASW